MSSKTFGGIFWLSTRFGWVNQAIWKWWRVENFESGGAQLMPRDHALLFKGWGSLRNRSSLKNVEAMICIYEKKCSPATAILPWLPGPLHEEFSSSDLYMEFMTWRNVAQWEYMRSDGTANKENKLLGFQSRVVNHLPKPTTRSILVKELEWRRGVAAGNRRSKAVNSLAVGNGFASSLTRAKDSAQTLSFSTPQPTN